MGSVIKAASGNHDGNTVHRKRSDLRHQLSGTVMAAITGCDITEGPFLIGNPLIDKVCQFLLSTDAFKFLCLLPKFPERTCYDAILHFSHLKHVLETQVQHTFQRKLFINGVCTVQCSAVRSLNAIDIFAEILFQRVFPHLTQIVETNIRGDLEFQHYPVHFQLFKKKPAFRRIQLCSVKPVPHAHVRELLPRTECLFNRQNAVQDVVGKRVIFTGMYTHDKRRYIFRDLHNCPDDRHELADIIDLLSDKVTACHIRIDSDRFQHLEVLLKIVAAYNLIFNDCKRNPAQCRKEA